jgi:hypothetical protein
MHFKLNCFQVEISLKINEKSYKNERRKDKLKPITSFYYQSYIIQIFL